jgi:group I intron endonuclease
MGGIYFIFCKTNNKTYIGSAKNLHTRWDEHRGMLIKQTHFNRNLQSAWNKYGAEQFEYSIKEELGEYDKKYFFLRENYWIDLYRESKIPIFNIARAEGGWGPETFLRKNEIGAKISTSLKEHAKSLTQEERNALYGKGKKGIALSEEHKRKTSEGLRGIKKSEETKKRMSLAQQNTNPMRAENMAHIGKQNIGRTPINAIPIIIDGVEYKSCQLASIVLGIPYRQVTKMRKAQNDSRKDG